MNNLQTLRTQIDDIDAAWVALLAKRFEVTARVGKLKASSDITPVDPAREKFQIARIRQLAERHGVNPDLAQNILRLIIDESVRNHQRIRKNKN